MNCRDFREIIDSYLSDELLTETNHDVLRHMEDCADCRNVIRARREVRQRLKTAVIDAPQYQIGKNFTHNLQTHLRHEALGNKTVKSDSWFSFKSLTFATAGLVLVFTFGFIFLNINTAETPSAASASHITTEFPATHIINAAFSDHQYCAVEYDTKYPVRLAKTPEKYKNLDEIALPELRNVLVGYELKKSHTCKFENTDFTHLVLAKDNQTVSLMLTERQQAEKFSKDISFSSSSKYEMARFDVGNTSVFVVSALDREGNYKVANALYNPLQKYLKKENNFQTALLFIY